MRAYRFPLATVARIRALEERLARERFMVALRDLRRAQDAHKEAAAALAALGAPTGPTTMGEVHWIQSQAERLSEQVQRSREVVVGAVSTRDEASGAWRVALKRSSVLERLDARSLARWRDEVQRGEVAELDDLANARYGLVGGSR